MRWTGRRPHDDCLAGTPGGGTGVHVVVGLVHSAGAQQVTAIGSAQELKTGFPAESASNARPRSGASRCQPLQFSVLNLSELTPEKSVNPELLVDGKELPTIVGCSHARESGSAAVAEVKYSSLMHILASGPKSS